jgi:hypothetical protein
MSINFQFYIVQFSFVAPTVSIDIVSFSIVYKYQVTDSGFYTLI